MGAWGTWQHGHGSRAADGRVRGPNLTRCLAVRCNVSYGAQEPCQERVGSSIHVRPRDWGSRTGRARTRSEPHRPTRDSCSLQLMLLVEPLHALAGPNHQRPINRTSRACIGRRVCRVDTWFVYSIRYLRHSSLNATGNFLTCNERKRRSFAYTV